MVMVFRIFLVLLFVPFLFSQNREVHYYELKYVSATEVLPFIEKMISPDGDIRFQPVKNSIQVSDYPERLKIIQDFINKTDTPPQKYKITIKLFEASQKQGGGTITKEIEGIKVQLRKLTPYSSYKLLDEISIEAEPGAKIDQAIARDYQITFFLKRFIGNPNAVKLLDLEFSKVEKKEKNVKIISPLMKTSLNLMLGRTQILGASSSVDEAKALIFVFYVNK
ncbi:MAG: secretin N-terminal domain-containing protein [Thermoanaerobaculia bacterium]